MEDWRHGGFGLYVHWPYCVSKCPYCDFNSHVSTSVDQDRWARAYLSEIERAGTELGGRILNSVFFGGGTPSLMSPDLVAAILERVRQTWTLANDCEITLEANPGSVETGRFRGFRDAGVNRISMGIQALNDADLRRLGRLHSASDARRAFDVGRTIFDRVSFDLIYGRQDQSLSDWDRELKTALNMAADHLSLYQLTIEKGTVFGQRFERGQLHGLPNEDASADAYELTQSACDAAGLSAYEVSNHAQKGSESRHNLIYWRMGDYVGIGPGAHGRLTIHGQRYATEAPKLPEAWLSRVEKGGNGELERSILSFADQANEYLMMSLRLTEGMEVSRYEKLTSARLPVEKMTHLEEIGMVSLIDDRLVPSLRGRMVLNSLIAEIAGFTPNLN